MQTSSTQEFSNSLPIEHFFSEKTPLDAKHSKLNTLVDLLKEILSDANIEIPSFVSIEWLSDTLSNIINTNYLNKNSSNFAFSSQLLESISNVLDTLDEFQKKWIINALEKPISTKNDENSQKIKNEINKIEGDGIAIYNAFHDIQNVSFDYEKQKFLKRPIPSKTLNQFFNYSSNLTSEFYKQRYDQLIRRTNRHPNLFFSNEISNVHSIEQKVMITVVDGVKFSIKEQQYIMGFLRRNRDGEISIQGNRMEYVLKFNNDVKIEDGVYGDLNIVVIRGKLDEYKHIIYVSEMMHPPRDKESEIEEQDLFGGFMDEDELILWSKYEEQTNQITNKKNSKWAVLSQIYLDQPIIINYLEKLFNFFEQPSNTPIGIVFMGSFCSSKFDIPNTQIYTNSFNSLYNLLKKHIYILYNCYLIFVPGPEDACFLPEMMPRYPILSISTNYFKERLESEFPQCKGKIIFSTSPCRIRNFSKKMIFCSDNSFSSSSKNICYSSMNDSLVENVLSSIVGQAHICPAKSENKINKIFDQSLRLYPLPNLICISDPSLSPSLIQPALSSTDTTICNISPFEYVQYEEDKKHSIPIFYLYDIYNFQMNEIKLE